MKNVFTNEKVTIEEQEILLSESLKFTGCEVFFKNCTINACGMEISIFLNSCSRVLVSGCTFLNFRGPVFMERKSGPMVIWDSIFENCMATNIWLKGSETYYGGVIHTEPIKESATKLIMDTVFVKCEYSTRGDNGIIANGYCEVYNCRYDYGKKRENTNPDDSIGFSPMYRLGHVSSFKPASSLFRDGLKGSGNKVISEPEEKHIKFSFDIL